MKNKLLFSLGLPLVLALSALGCKKQSGSEVLATTTVGSDVVDLTTYKSSNAEDNQRLRQEITRRADGSVSESYACLKARAEQIQGKVPEGSAFRSIPVDELVAIRIYTGSEYREINRLLRTRDAAGLGTWHGTVVLASSGLNRLPSYREVVERGATLSPAVIKLYEDAKNAGKPITERGFISTTFGKVENIGFSGNVKFVIRGKSGRRIDEISLFPNEKEVLFPPGADFNVKSVRKVSRAEATDAGVAPPPGGGGHTPFNWGDTPEACRSSPAPHMGVVAQNASGASAKDGLGGPIGFPGQGGDGATGMALLEDDVTIIEMDETGL